MGKPSNKLPEININKKINKKKNKKNNEKKTGRN